MKKNPFVSVIIPVYNAQQFVEIALQSVARQSYKNFECIIVDDASTDRTLKILKDFQSRDKRIVVVRNKKNLGVTKSLNKALLVARGKYIIRMDADDWSYPERFALQVLLMERNPDVVVGGSYVEVCDRLLRTNYVRRYHVDDASIRKRLFRYSPFAHPTTIWRADILKKLRYNENIKIGQDYELYFRMGRVGKFANIPKPLLKLRMHEGSVSATMNDLQSKATIEIRRNAVRKLGYQMTYFDLTYNKLQELGIGFIPIRLRFSLFNFLRRFSFY